jgi:hypothetical protein
VISNFRSVVQTLRAAERQRTVLGAGRHPVWVTELWWETDPPDGRFGMALAKLKRWIPEAIRTLTAQGAEVILWAQVFDDPAIRGFGGYQTGIFFSDGARKPIYQAWRFPFLTARQTPTRIVAWMLPPTSGSLTIERRQTAGGWRAVRRVRVRAATEKTVSLGLRGGATFRARLGSEVSLPWTQSGR